MPHWQADLFVSNPDKSGKFSSQCMSKSPDKNATNTTTLYKGMFRSPDKDSVLPNWPRPLT